MMIYWVSHHDQPRVHDNLDQKIENYRENAAMKDKSRENNNLSTTLHLQVPLVKMSQYLHSSYFCCANKSKAQEKMVSNKLNYKASTLLHLLLRILIKGLLAAPFFGAVLIMYATSLYYLEFSFQHPEPQAIARTPFRPKARQGANCIAVKMKHVFCRQSREKLFFVTTHTV